MVHLLVLQKLVKLLPLLLLLIKCLNPIVGAPGLPWLVLSLDAVLIAVGSPSWYTPLWL